YVPRRAGARGAIEAGLTAGTLPGGRRLDDADDRAAVEAVWGEGLPSERGRDLHAILSDAAAGKIDVLHLIGVDLARDAASTALAQAALAKIGTVIVQDLAATETLSAHADVVLPVTGRQERAGTSTNWEGRRQRFARAVDGPDLVQDDWEIVVQLAALLGHDLGVDDLEAIRGEIARLGQRDTPHELHAASDTPADASPADDEGLAVSIRALLLDRGTMLTGASDLNATSRRGTVQLAPVTAEQIGVTDGDRVAITGLDAGDTVLTLTVEVRRDVLPGVAILPANSTPQSAYGLADRDGSVRITLSALADDDAVAPRVEEVA
ncbi:MAG: molybdopterin-dependent oxidoreductase, partial [Nitriliruptoraceae bacterium]|nr:molybdopterin-dependent oxidoreductase [Nitriliruptoraceae bacterium]